MRHLFFFFLSGIFRRAREEFVNGYGTQWQWMGPLSKIKKRNERRKRRCGKASEIQDFGTGPNIGQSARFPLELVNVRDVGRGVITVGIVLSRAGAQCKNAHHAPREKDTATQKASPPHYRRSRLLLFFLRVRPRHGANEQSREEKTEESWKSGVRSFAAAERTKR